MARKLYQDLMDNTVIYCVIMFVFSTLFIYTVSNGLEFLLAPLIEGYIS